MKFSRGTARGNPNPAASMALLEEVLDPPVGPGYHSAATAREAAGLPASTGYSTPLMFVSALALGALVTASAITLRTPDPVAAETRAQLITRIEAAQARGDETSSQVEALRGEIAALEQGLARQADGPDAERALAAAGLSVGAQSVVGPGVSLLLEDALSAPPGAPGENAKPTRVNARDLQLVTNALWATGAEAIAVNGHRLTTTSAIRFAGEAIIVDFRALAPPYEVLAIGDPDRLRTEATTGWVGAYLGELRSQLGIRSTVTAQDELTLPPAERLTTRVGSVPDDIPQERR